MQTWYLLHVKQLGWQVWHNCVPSTLKYPSLQTQSEKLFLLRVSGQVLQVVTSEHVRHLYEHDEQADTPAS